MSKVVSQNYVYITAYFHMFHFEPYSGMCCLVRKHFHQNVTKIMREKKEYFTPLKYRILAPYILKMHKLIPLIFLNVQNRYFY